MRLVTIITEYRRRSTYGSDYKIGKSATEEISVKKSLTTAMSKPVFMHVCQPFGDFGKLQTMVNETMLPLAKTSDPP